ncbi:MAG: undecaprenyl/decaprenyl-phosphate alpha-N-acetylglucosaminyl 1-phosphate transferase [bacterium]|nr:undecaprenyl/decaprenyl-phosphate alpha-N-acetylglucosaminyl 1-phosphate transferase [bacterium]
MDYPGGRRVHLKPVPRLGGFAVGGALAMAAGAVAIAMLPGWGGRLHKEDVAALIIATSIIFIVGLAEDLVSVSASKRFLVEAFAALILVSVGWEFRVLGLPGVNELQLGWLGPIITVIWIVGVTNAINLLDGLDGLAAGVVAIIAGSYLVFCIIKGEAFSAVLMAAVCGACLGFLRHNWAPATVFMGDAGSLTLGFLLAATTVHASLKATGAVVMLVPVLALGVPVIDTLLVMLTRFLRRPGGTIKERLRDVFRADRSHLHHALESVQRNRPAVVRIIYILVATTCVMAFAVAITKSGIVGWTLVVVEVAVILAIRQLRWARVVARRLARNRNGIRQTSSESSSEGICAGQSGEH